MGNICFNFHECYYCESYEDSLDSPTFTPKYHIYNEICNDNIYTQFMSNKEKTYISDEGFINI